MATKYFKWGKHPTEKIKDDYLDPELREALPLIVKAISILGKGNHGTFSYGLHLILLDDLDDLRLRLNEEYGDERDVL